MFFHIWLFQKKKYKKGNFPHWMKEIFFAKKKKKKERKKENEEKKKTIKVRIEIFHENKSECNLKAINCQKSNQINCLKSTAALI